MDYKAALTYASPGTHSVAPNDRAQRSTRPLNNMSTLRQRFNELHTYATAMTTQHDRRVKEINDIRRLMPFLVSHVLRTTSAVTVLADGLTAEEIPVFARPLEAITDVCDDPAMTLREICKHLEILENYVVTTLSIPTEIREIKPLVPRQTETVSVAEINTDASRTIENVFNRMSLEQCGTRDTKVEFASQIDNTEVISHIVQTTIIETNANK